MQCFGVSILTVTDDFTLPIPNAWAGGLLGQDAHCRAVVSDDIFGPLRINDHSIVNTYLLGVGIEAAYVSK
jgi:hypothetical protein